MNAITLRQPWASMIALRWKSIETRTHSLFSNLVGQRIAIHAGKSWDDEAEWFLLRWGRRDVSLVRHEIQNAATAAGVIVCTAQVIDFSVLDKTHSEMALIDCDSKRLFGLFLQDIQPTEHLPARGALGVWTTESRDITDEMLEAVE